MSSGQSKSLETGEAPAKEDMEEGDEQEDKEVGRVRTVKMTVKAVREKREGKR